jgi:hypothetical protein
MSVKVFLLAVLAVVVGLFAFRFITKMMAGGGTASTAASTATTPAGNTDSVAAYLNSNG